MSHESRMSDEEFDQLLVGFAVAARSIRAREDLTQEEVAQGAGLDRKTVARIERVEERPQVGTLDALARGLRLPGGKYELYYEALRTAKMLTRATIGAAADPSRWDKWIEDAARAAATEARAPGRLPPTDPQEVLDEIGTAFRTARRDLNLSQRAVAEKARVGETSSATSKTGSATLAFAGSFKCARRSI